MQSTPCSSWEVFLSPTVSCDLPARFISSDGLPSVEGIDYGFVHWFHQASWRIPVILQCCFAIPAGVTAYFLPDTPRWYYARNKLDQGDATLCQLYDQPLDSDTVQYTKRQIMTAIEIELEANESISWRQFLTFGLVDTTKLKIIRRLCICFWLPMVSIWHLFSTRTALTLNQLGEWMGISLLAYFAPVILKGIGTSEGTIAVLSGVLTTCMFLGTIPLYWYVELHLKSYPVA